MYCHQLMQKICERHIGSSASIALRIDRYKDFSLGLQYQSMSQASLHIKVDIFDYSDIPAA